MRERPRGTEYNSCIPNTNWNHRIIFNCNCRLRVKCPTSVEIAAEVVCCRVLWCIAMCCRVLQCVVMYWTVFQCVTTPPGQLTCVSLYFFPSPSPPSQQHRCQPACILALLPSCPSPSFSPFLNPCILLHNFAYSCCRPSISHTQTTNNHTPTNQPFFFKSCSSSCCSPTSPHAVSPTHPVHLFLLRLALTARRIGRTNPHYERFYSASHFDLHANTDTPYQNALRQAHPS